MKDMVKCNKCIYIEFIRIFAIFWVIYNHTGQFGFFLFSTKSPKELSFWIYLCISVFCKVAVPLFFSVSGALLLGRTDEGLKKLWKNRIFMMIIILLFFSIIHYLNYIHATSGTVDIEMFVKLLYAGPIPAFGHLWYLYAYIVFLILLPFLNSLVSKLEDKYFYYMIVIVLFLNVCKVFEYIVWKGDSVLCGEVYDNIWINIDILLYPCVGYFLHHRIKVDAIGKKLPVLWGINTFGILSACFMTYCIGQVTGTLDECSSQDFLSSFVVINCITLFLTIRYIFEKASIPNVLKKMIISVGKTTFGIYLIHLLVKHYLSETKIIPIIKGFSFNSMLAVLLYCFGIMMVCYLIIVIWLKIPYVKKLVGGK